MVDRIKIVTDDNRLRSLFEVPAGPAIRFLPHWNGAPAQDFPVLRRNPETSIRGFDMLGWGLVPAWAKTLNVAYSNTNAKAERVATSAAFRHAWKDGRRGILPLDGFYEWKRVLNLKQQPYLIARADQQPMAVAVLWEGKKLETGKILRTFTIVTTEAIAPVRPLHHRMPVILAMEDVSTWLGETEASADEIAALMRPCPAAWLTSVPVDRRMSFKRNQSAEFCQPLPDRIRSRWEL